MILISHYQSSILKTHSRIIHAVQQDTQSVLMSEFIHHVWQLNMFRTSPVHHQERFLQAAFADLVCGSKRFSTYQICEYSLSETLLMIDG